MKTIKEIRASIAKRSGAIDSYFPKPTEEQIREEQKAGCDWKLTDGSIARLIKDQDQDIRDLVDNFDAFTRYVSQMLTGGVKPSAPGGPAAPGGDPAAAWVMSGLDPNDRSPPPGAAATPAGGDPAAAWVMDGIDPGTGPAAPPAAPVAAPASAQGGPPTTPPQILPNVQATGGAQPPEIQAMLAEQAKKAEQAKQPPKGK